MVGGEFQSVYNLNELFVSLQVQQVQNPDLAMLESSETQLGKMYQLFKGFA